MLELLSQVFKSTDCSKVVNEAGILKVQTYKGGKLQAMFTQSPTYTVYPPLILSSTVQ